MSCVPLIDVPRFTVLRSRVKRALDPAHPTERLRAMLADHPQNARELRAVSGVGDSKLERYGEAFLAVLRDERL